MSDRRKPIPTSVKQMILHESGYRCSNPICRTIITIEIHHLDYVSEGGGDTADNLLALCPNCHTLHHAGQIPITSLKTWKLLLLSLNEGFDRKNIDVLLAMPILRCLQLSGDGLIQIAGLIASGYMEIIGRVSPNGAAPGAQGYITVGLTKKGQQFIESWRLGNQRAAIMGGHQEANLQDDHG